MPDVALSFVIPLFHSAETIGDLVHEIEALDVPGGHEIVLVNDGSVDATSQICRALVQGSSTMPSSPAGARPAAPTSSTSTTTVRIRRGKR